MPARNGTESFGWVSRALHWAMALGLFGALGLGTYLARTEPSLGTLWLYGLHKTVGICLLALVLLRLAWHRISPPPAPLPAPDWQRRAARASHLTLYALMVAVPLSGWAASSATGIDSVIFGRWVLPPIAPASEAVDRIGFALHGALTKAMMALVILHAGAALWHHLSRRDATLRRMLRG